MKNLLKKKWWLIAAAVLVIVAIAVVLIVAKPDQSAEDPTTGATTETTTETTAEPTTPEQTEEPVVDETVQTTAPETVQVEILGYEFTLNAQIAEKVFCRELADTAETDVEVYTKLGEQEYTLFTMIFNSTEGDIVHMLGNAEEKLPIAFMMNELPEGLSDEEAAQFYMAQGAVNDIMGSIKAK